MIHRGTFFTILLPLFVSIWSPANAQTTTAAQPQTTAPLPPATKLEGFKPAAGTVVTFGYDELGKTGGPGILAPISVDVRELRSAKGEQVRGLVVEVSESPYRDGRSFVDADELPELLKGIDALLEVQSNPTQFKNFEVRYKTRGELELTAYNGGGNPIKYAVKAGRGVAASKNGLNASDMKKLRDLFEAGMQKLSSLK